jgi:hypothetical protein
LEIAKICSITASYKGLAYNSEQYGQQGGRDQLGHDGITAGAFSIPASHNLILNALNVSCLVIPCHVSLCPAQINTDSRAASLPQALTAQILQHVPQQQRLSNVPWHKAWATAAAAATVHVEYSPTAATLPVFQAWLKQHAGQILTLNVHTSQSDNYDHTLLLPVSSLRQLQLLHAKGLGLHNSDDTFSADNTSTGSNGDPTPVAEGTALQTAAADRTCAAPLPRLSGEGSSSSSSRGDTLVARGTTPQAAAAAAAAVPLPRLQQLYLKTVELGSINSLLQLTQSQALISVQLHSISLAEPFRAPSSFSGGLLSKSATAMRQLELGVSHMLQQLPQGCFSFSNSLIILPLH